jgi:hypothetical protein
MPAAEPLAFRATGPLAGSPRCAGKLTFTGQFHAGSSCNSTQSWDGRVNGLPGVVRFAGAGTILSNSFMYDEAGHVVGSEQALVQALPGDSALTDCDTAEGFTHGHFSSVVELY